MKKLMIVILVVLAGVPALFASQPDSSEIRKMLDQRDNEIKELLGPKGTEYTEQKREQLKNIINGVIDYAAMAQYALQETYDTLTSMEREEFVDYFSTIVRDQSLNNLDIYRAEVSYNSIDVEGDSATVNTTAFLEKVRTPVIYDMYFKEKPGEWVIIDMTIDDVSTAESYRQQFSRIIQKRGYDYLLSTLEKRASK